MKKPQFLKQKNMVQVLTALIPVQVAAIFLFGWRSAALVLVSVLIAFITEWIMAENRKGKVSYACFVTACLYGLSLPPTLPFWMAAVGAIIAILFGKEVFGGFGKNVFNPAVVGRAFVYVCFPVEMTGSFVAAFKTFPGGFTHWNFSSTLAAQGAKAVDVLTAATPMWALRDFGYLTKLSSLFWGTIGGTFTVNGESQILAAGSAGEVSAVAILIGAIYLLINKTANWRLMAGTLIGAVGLNVLLRHIMGLSDVPPVMFTLLSGGLLYATVFMVTDPVSAPKQRITQWIYAIFIGMMVVLFRYKAVFAGGVAFAILLGNTLAPSLDLWFKRIMNSKKESA